MTTFTIDPENNITAHASLKEAQAANIAGAEYFGSQKELAQLAASWPVAGAHGGSKLLDQFVRVGQELLQQAQQFQVEVAGLQLRQLQPEQFFIPTGVQSQLVVGDDQRSPLRFAEAG